MSVELIQKWMSEFSYKPGWTFDITNGPLNDGLQIAVWINTNQPDSYHPERTVPVQNLAYIDMSYSREQFFLWLYHQVLIFEKHETDEWFRVDGKLVHDPHRSINQ